MQEFRWFTSSRKLQVCAFFANAVTVWVFWTLFAGTGEYAAYVVLLVGLWFVAMCFIITVMTISMALVAGVELALRAIGVRLGYVPAPERTEDHMGVA